MKRYLRNSKSATFVSSSNIKYFANEFLAKVPKFTKFTNFFFFVKASDPDWRKAREIFFLIKGNEDCSEILRLFLEYYLSDNLIKYVIILCHKKLHNTFGKLHCLMLHHGQSVITKHVSVNLEKKQISTQNGALQPKTTCAFSVKPIFSCTLLFFIKSFRLLTWFFLAPETGLKLTKYLIHEKIQCSNIGSRL